MSEKYIIIGDGIAGITAVKTIRGIDKTSEIHVFGEEKYYPYNRVRLSKGLLSSLEEDKILLQKKDWYKSNDINLYLNTKVTKIDTSKKEVTLSNGKIISFGKLLLANGAKNYTPPIKGIDKKEVLNLRTLKDALDIISSTKQMDTILNIGGGIQGLEMAWILSNLGKKVIVAEILPRIMPKQLDEKASEILQNEMKKHNIELLLNTQVNEIFGENKVTGFKTKNDDSINCDGVIYSVGLSPNIDILKNTEIKTNYGVLVDDKMNTNIKDIYAAGDVCEYENHIFGLWNIAIGQGKIAGQNMAGNNSTYTRIVPVTTLNAFNISLFSMGDIDEKGADNILLEDNSNENLYSKIFIKNNKVTGAIVIGNIRSSPVLKTAIEKEKDIKDIDFKNISIDEFVEELKRIK